MTPKEEAKSIYGSMYIQMTEGFILGRKEQAKQCALIAVEKIIVSIKDNSFPVYYNGYYMGGISIKGYWNEVKTEIEKL